jgi:signal transduction histidine kinase
MNIKNNKRNYYNGIFLIGVLLLSFTFVYNHFHNSKNSVQESVSILSKWIKSQNRSVLKIYNDSTLNQSLDSIPLLFNYLDSKRSSEWVNLYISNQDQQIIYWSTDKVIPNNINIQSFGTEQKLIKISNAYHLIKVYPLKNGYHLISLLTIYQIYPVENKYLKSGFLLDNPAFKMTMITSRENVQASISLPVYNKDSKLLFYVRDNPNANRLILWPIVLLEILGFLFIFLIINRYLGIALHQNKLKKAFVITLFYFSFIEIYINLWNIPSFTGIGNLFKLESYASPFLADSLGELFLRLQLLHWIIRNWMVHALLKSSNKEKSLFSVLLSLYLATSFYLTVFIIASLHHNSTVSFDLYRFDQLGFNSLLGVLIINFAFGIMYIPVRFIKIEYFNKTFFILQLLTHIGFIAIGFLFEVFDSYQFAIGLLLIYIIYLMILYLYCRVQRVEESQKFFLNLILFTTYSFIGASCILYYTNERKIEMVQHYAIALASERDYAEEFDISNRVDEIKEDNFIKSYFENPYLTSFDIGSRIQQRYFNKYLGKYNISINAFNNEGIQLKGEGAKTFYALRTSKNQKGVQKVSPYMYYLSVKPRGEKYMVSIDYRVNDTLLGDLMIVFTPKTLTPYSAYPELLKSEQDNSIFNNISNITYAIYRNKNLMNVYGNFSYPSKFKYPLPASGKYIIEAENDNVHLIYRMQEKQVIVTYKRIGFLSAFSFYSYLLILQLIFFYILSVLTDYGSIWMKGRRMFQSFRINTLQKQIQISMVSQVLISLVLIGSMTIFFFNVQYNHLHNESLKQRGLSVTDAIEILYAESFVENHDDVFTNILKSKMKQLSEIFAIDMNAYDMNGKLLFSSQPDIFKGGLQSTLINPIAYKALKIDGYSSFVHDEMIGNLKYIAAYLPVKDPNGDKVGYINFPYYGKEVNIKNDISFFLMSLVNIYVLLILGAALLSVWVSKVIVKPLSIITENIKEVELGKNNRHIVWKNKDEIGQLVDEYNRMIGVLDESAVLLAKSEREGAWREMAKQVAHEIKNPLTPMKLSIQHLQRALDENREDSEEMTKRIAARLIEQIDTLANIATAFSDFAKMPVGYPKNENIISILNSVVELFISSQEVAIQTSIPHYPIYVYTDKDQMIRVFTNIIKNAIQSIPTPENGLLEISVKEYDGYCNIIVKDNGVGIPLERAKDIFEPNFTTKSSGTGLGLAMSKSIIENTGGQIWFESDAEKGGTSFFIRLNTI